MILDFAITTLKNGQHLIAGLGLVETSDLRLSDARAPLAHSHPASELSGVVAGTDPAWLLWEQMERQAVVDRTGTLVVTRHGAPVWAQPA